MNKAVWVLQVLVALAFAGAGGTKLAKSGTELRADPNMAWSTDFSDAEVKTIGSAEVAGALGLILPAATGVVPVLSPVAGVALGALMGGAVIVHVKRGESPVFPLVLGLLAMTAGLLRLHLLRRRRA